MSHPRWMNPIAVLHRHRRAAKWAILVTLAATGLADHLGAFGDSSDPWRKFDRAGASVLRVIDCATVEANVRGEKTIVRLLGVKPVDDSRAKTHLARLLGLEGEASAEPQFAGEFGSAGASPSRKPQLTREFGSAGDSPSRKTVRLKLEPLQPRNGDGQLLAYVFINEIDNVNLAMIRDGFAKADRSREHTFGRMFQTTESVARKAKRGIWGGE